MTAETLAKKGGNQTAVPTEHKSLKQLTEQYEKQVIEDLLNQHGQDVERQEKVDFSITN